MAALATKAGVEGRPLRILAPLLQLSKADIIRRGLALGLDYGLTHSCYDPDRVGRAVRPLRQLPPEGEGFRRGGRDGSHPRLQFDGVMDSGRDATHRPGARLQANAPGVSTLQPSSEPLPQ